MRGGQNTAMKKILLISIFIFGSLFFAKSSYASEFGYLTTTGSPNFIYGANTGDTLKSVTSSQEYYFYLNSPVAITSLHMQNGWDGTQGFTLVPVSLGNGGWKFTAPNSISNGSNGNVPFFGLNCYDGVNTPPCLDVGDSITFYSNPNALPLTLDFLYPQNSTSTYIHDFTSFTFSAVNTDSNAHEYNFNIYLDTTSTFDNFSKNYSRDIWYNFNPNALHYFNIPKPDDLASSTTYYAKLCARTRDVTTSSVIITDIQEYCINSIAFSIGANQPGFKINTDSAGFFNSTTSEVGIMYPPKQVTDASSVCGDDYYSPANWACNIGLKFTRTFDSLVLKTQTFLQDAVSNVKAVFPINAIVALNEDFNSVSATSTPNSIILTGQNNAFKKVGGGYYSFTFLTTSTLTSQSLDAVKSGFDWQTLVVYFIYILDGIIMIGCAFVLLHDSSKNTPK